MKLGAGCRMGCDASRVRIFMMAVLQESLHGRSQSGFLISREAEVAALPSPLAQPPGPQGSHAGSPQVPPRRPDEAACPGTGSAPVWSARGVGRFLSRCGWKVTRGHLLHFHGALWRTVARGPPRACLGGFPGSASCMWQP